MQRDVLRNNFFWLRIRELEIDFVIHLKLVALFDRDIVYQDSIFRNQLLDEAAAI
jgi:hypothetical protein